MSGDLLILTGPPGAGKSTIAARIASEHGSPAVHLHSDDFFRYLKAGAIPPWEQAAETQNGTVMNAIAAAADRYATGGCFVVIDGIVGPWFLAPFRALDRPVHYVVLRPAMMVTMARAQARGDDALTASAPLKSMYEQFADLGAFEQHVIDTGMMDIDGALSAVRDAVDGRYRL